jgi:IS4 transposase
MAEGVDLMAKGMPDPVKVFGKTLCEAFPPEWIEKTAMDVELIERERRVKAVPLFWSLVFGFGVQLQKNLAYLKRCYEQRAKNTLSYSSWYDHLSPELAEFMKLNVRHGIEHMAQSPNRQLGERLRSFSDVMIQDSTIIRLNAKLSNKFKVTRSRKVAAGAKVSLLVSAVANGPKSVTISSESKSEGKTLRIGPWVKDRIILFDLGFYKHQMFARILDNGGHLVSRLKTSADPLIVSVNNRCPGNSINVVGKKINEVLPELKRQVLDVMVEIPFKRRKYKGRSSTDVKQFRVVAVLNEEEKKYHTYITDIGCDTLTAEEIAKLYGARWEIELIFKELKSRYAFDQIKTSKAHIVEALIWAGILTLIASRIVYHLLRKIAEAQGKSLVRFTHMRWSTIFSEGAYFYLSLVMKYLKMDITGKELLQVHLEQAMDPHINRQRFREGFWS